MSNKYFSVTFVDPEVLTSPQLCANQLTAGRWQVQLGDSGAFAYVTAADALAISEAWRTIEQAILEREHGVAALTDAQADRLLADVRALGGYVDVTPEVAREFGVEMAGE